VLGFPQLAQHSPDALNELAYELNKTFSFKKTDYSDSHNEMILSSPSSKGTEITKCGIFANRIEFTKGPIEQGSIHVFNESISTAIKVIVQKLRLPVFIQQNTVVVLASPPQKRDSREFLAFDVYRFKDDQLKKFGRNIHCTGLRWFFLASSEHPNDPEFDVRIETLIRDVNMLYIENKSRFPNPINSTDVEQITRNLNATREFIHTRVFEFLSQFEIESGGA
jgi:hypothetical protein